MKTARRTLLWQLALRLRYDLLAVVVVATVATALTERVSLERFTSMLSLLGVVASIFIGFRLRSAYSTWLDAQKLWEAVGVNSRALMNALTIVDNCTPQMAAVTDRMLRRQVRHVWELAAELRRVPPAPEVPMLTPEDPSDATAVDLLAYQAADSRYLTLAELIDSKARNILTNLNTAAAGTTGGLKVIRDEPFPVQYVIFVRPVVWMFGALICASTHGVGLSGLTAIAAGVGVMAILVVAERLGDIIGQPLDQTVFGLPTDRFCTRITADLLGADHPLARHAVKPANHAAE